MDALAPELGQQPVHFHFVERSRHICAVKRDSPLMTQVPQPIANIESKCITIPRFLAVGKLVGAMCVGPFYEREPKSAKKALRGLRQLS